MKKNKRKNPLLIIILLLLLAGMGFLGYHLFNITSIKVNGNEQKKADYIISLSGLKTGDNIFKVDDKIVKQNLEKDPYIKFIGVTKNYPDKIIIEIKERVPAVLVPLENKSLLLDEEGYVLQILNETNGQAYPAVSGMDLSKSALGKKISFADEAQEAALHNIVQAINSENMREIITAIDLLNINNIKMTTAGNIAVNFGNYQNAAKKMQWIKGVLAYFNENGIKEGTVDVSTGEFATYHSGQ